MKRTLRYFSDYEYDNDDNKITCHVLDAVTNEIKTVKELKTEVEFYLAQGFRIEAINTGFITAKKSCRGPLDLFNYKNDFNLIH